MNEHPHDEDLRAGASAAESASDGERLVHRAVSGEAGDADWDRLEAMAAQQPELWRELGLALRDESSLRQALQMTLASADAVELPHRIARRPARHAARLRRWTGWAAAAILALLWIGSGKLWPSQPDAVAATTTDEAFELYRQLGMHEGRLVEELPLLLVESESVEGGQRVEVIYLRRMIERRTVHGVGETGIDELGQPVVVPVSHESIQSREL